MLSKKQTTILEIIAWCSVLVISVKETINVYSIRKNYNEELKNFYSLQNERDKAIAKKREIFNELPMNIIKSLIFLFFVIFLLTHIRLKKLIELKNTLNKEDVLSVKAVNIKTSKTENEKNNLLSIVFLTFVSIFTFFIINGLGISFFDKKHNYQKLSFNQRIKRNLNKISFFSQRKVDKKNE